MIRKGIISIPSGVFPDTHELLTAQVLVDAGRDIVFIAPSRTKGVRTPDIVMNGLMWEIKCSTGAGRHTVQRQLKRASRQADSVIFDSVRTKIADDIIYEELRRNLLLSKSLKRLIFINKQRLIIELR